MTREDIKKAAHEFPMNIDGDDLIVVDFAVVQVRRHNEELTAIVKECATVEIAVRRFREAKP